MFKRLFDFVVALLLLIFLSPLLLLLSLLIAWQMGRPVIFRQIRPGRHTRLFRLYKFRTMRELYGADGALLADAERLTSLGRIIRAGSLDELPQLWNVLRGDMSLVGPRPLLPEYLTRYTTRQARRHEVRPGITGWAQVNGRNALSWEIKFELDVWYVDHQSLWLDCRVLWLTLMKVIKREGISQAGEATVRPFLGTVISSEKETLV